MTPPLANWTWSLDGWIIVAGALCGAASALLGPFLVLRRMSLLGDAISHAVLPGLAAAFLLTGERSNAAMFVGAVVVGLLTALFTEWVHRAGQVDEGASMGVVFTTLFALGLVMIVRAADRVDLDAGCVLYGAIELTPLDTWRIAGLEAPRVVVVLTVVTLINALFVTIFFKELRLAAFDPALADTSGFRSAWMHYALMTLVAVTAVASFEAVGNILVVAMLVTPAATARLLTDRLGTMVLVSVAVAVVAAPLGHASAVVVPGWFGLSSTTTAGMMAVATGLLFALAVVAAPRHGLVGKLVRRWRLRLRIVAEDVLGVLYRDAESRAAADRTLDGAEVRRRIGGGNVETWIAVAALRHRDWLRAQAGGLTLTDEGKAAAGRLVRAHRLWESYLVERAGVAADRTHPTAEELEHVTDSAMRAQLDAETIDSPRDPHGREIPAEADPAERDD